jgi:hypothetical protein
MILDATHCAGEYAKLRALVVDNLRACQLAGLGALGLQLLALLVSCSLYYAENKPRLDYTVLRQLDYDNASQASFPAAGHGGASASHGGGRSARGTAHTMPLGGPRQDYRRYDKYTAGGVQDEGFGYDPELGRAQARGDDDVADRPKRGCSIM